MNIVALIPARAGSKRILGKNTKLLAGKPLIQWTIEAAQQSGLFDRIYVSTDSSETVQLAIALGASGMPRDPRTAQDYSPDIYWVRGAFDNFDRIEYRPDAFAILRPTSPFRTAFTIHRAVAEFQNAKCSSVRAVEPVKQHPGKMWQATRGLMKPLMGDQWPPEPGAEVGCRTRIPWHSQPTQELPNVYVQNASLEIAHRWCVDVFDSISGPIVAPFFTEGWEGFDINTPDDWDRAEAHAQTLLARVP